ncbi:unnamed protein product [Prunus armeniaca]|uniref:Uncharacterized protein n=1 Tax=Prunus armeniaca TaxID=36596 RepID=A0A6J5Y0W1_PRUAR|nr:unnamed protein product [Prunus armeniaca]
MPSITNKQSFNASNGDNHVHDYFHREGKDLNIFESICLKKGENRLNQFRSALRLHHIRHISHIRSAQQQTLTLHSQGCNLHHRKHRDLEIVHPRAKPATSPSTIVFEPKLDRITETTGPTDRTRSSQRRQIRRVCLNAIFAKASNPNVTNVSVIAIVDDFVESNQSFLGSGIRLGLEPRRETVGGFSVICLGFGFGDFCFSSGLMNTIVSDLSLSIWMGYGLVWFCCFSGPRKEVARVQ